MIDFNDLREEKKSDLKVVLVVIIAFLFAFYVYDLLFGSRSYMRLLDLQNEYKSLKTHVSGLKKKNENDQRNGRKKQR